MLRRLGHQRLLSQNNELVVLAGKFQILRILRCGGRRGRLRERRGDHAARHIGGKRNSATNSSTHRHCTTAEKTTAADTGLSAERDSIGAFGIVTIKFFERALGCSGHRHILPADFFATATVITAQPAKRLLPERTPRNGCSPAATNNLAADAKGPDPEKARSVAALSPSVWPLRYRLWVLRSWAPYPVCF